MKRAQTNERGRHASPYLTECASCCAAFPRNSLNTAEWQQVLAGLEAHYGSNASLDAATLKPIAEYPGRATGSKSSRRWQDGDSGQLAKPRLTKAGWIHPRAP
ncbi:MAG: hypothetical protein IPG34_19415 [Rhodocyclaceae bacterium]|nr:hypothetical protein [Rhodocyclaceae bacterium]